MLHWRVESAENINTRRCQETKPPARPGSAAQAVDEVCYPADRLSDRGCGERHRPVNPSRAGETLFGETL
jgi:hypothetical protein